MYPNLYYAFKDLFGVEWSFLRFVNSFGFFVALSFIVSAMVLAHELKRKGKEGLLHPTEELVVVGKPATIGELVMNFLLGFLLGYKILALFVMDSSVTEDPQAFIFSGLGSWPLGLLMGGLFTWLKYYEKNKQKLPKPETRKVRIWPHDRVGEITVLALVFGLIGAKMFDIFENWGDFLETPSDYIFSPAGLTFYGGLICATIAIVLFARKHKIGLRHLADAIAPSLMIAYAIGRIGCQVAGDGDWGIFNSAYASTPEGNITMVDSTHFNESVSQNKAYFDNFLAQTDLQEVPHKYFPKPSALSFLPDWLFAYNYPNNVNKSGIPIAGCEEQHCNQLPVAAFPTAFYETVICFILFGILWGLRKRLKPFGALFALYLILNGLERFFIEKIRVNNRILGMDITQAEVISLGLILTGVILWIILLQKNRTTGAKA